MKQNPPLTLSQIRETLGFEPPDQFAKKRQEYNKAHVVEMIGCSGKSTSDLTEQLSRCTGRTTEMLIQAVQASQFGFVIIYGHNNDFTKYLVKEAKRFCLLCGLDPEHILSSPESGTSICGVFYDHYMPQDYS